MRCATVSRSVATSISRMGEPEGPPLRSFIRLRLRELSAVRHLAALVHHERAQELDHDLPGLGETGGLHPDNADVGTRFGLALLQDLAAGVDGLALEERI